MQHNLEDDFDVEDLIELLYQISDALHIRELTSARTLDEPNLCLSEILSLAHSRTVTLLDHACRRQHYGNAG